MTGPELKQLRADLGDAIGRRLSLADMATICGLAPGNGADTMRKWEAGEGPSGPVTVLLSIYAWAIDGHPIPGLGAGADLRRQVRDLIRYQLVRRLS